MRHRRLVSLTAAVILVAVCGVVAALLVVGPWGSSSGSCAPGGSAAATSPSTSAAAATESLTPTSLITLRMLDATHGWANRVTWVSPGTSNAAIATTTVVMTDDGGAQWRAVMTPGELIGASDAAHAWAEGKDGVYQTSDCGATWTRLALPVTNASVTFVDPDHGFLMGVYAQALAPPDDFQESFALWETSDAGAGWSAVTRVPSVKGPGPIAPIALPDGCPPVATGWSTLRTGWIVGVCLTGDLQPAGMGTAVLLVTHDGGRTWQPQRLPIPPSSTLSGLDPPAFTTPDDGEMVGITTSGAPCVYVTKDGGATWSPECGALPAPESTHPGAVIAPDGTAVTLLQDGAIAESTDAGRSWQTPGPPHPELAAASSLTELDFVNAEHGLISLASGALYATSDGGRTLHLVYRSPDAPLPGAASPSAGPSAPIFGVSPCPSSPTEPAAPTSCLVIIPASATP
jgi:photosystem II stability/assembly factor-like uncharacterized protein